LVKPLFLGAWVLTLAGPVQGAPLPPSAAGASAPQADPVLAASPYSDAAAETLQQKLDTLARRSQKGKPPREKTVTVTEGELNSYLNLTLAPKIPKGITDLVVRMDRDRLAARALVDLSEVQGQIPAGSLGGLLAFLSGKVPLEAAGRATPTESGFGSFSIEEVRLSTMPVPVSVVEQLIGSATKSASGRRASTPPRLPPAL
jgi:hypothetical protein